MIDFTAPITNQKADLSQDSARHSISRRRFGDEHARTAGTMPVYRPNSAQLRADYVPREPIKTQIQDQQKPDFKDFVDVINPLHHLPFIGGLYRNITGDEISPPAQFIGGLAYGGPFGAASALVDVAVKDHTGRGFGDNMIAMVKGDETAFSAKTITNADDTKWANTDDVQITYNTTKRTRFDGNMRMAGTMPPPHRLSPSTHFDTMIQNLTT